MLWLLNLTHPVYLNDAHGTHNLLESVCNFNRLIFGNSAMSSSEEIGELVSSQSDAVTAVQSISPVDGNVLATLWLIDPYPSQTFAYTLSQEGFAVYPAKKSSRGAVDAVPHQAVWLQGLFECIKKTLQDQLRRAAQLWPSEDGRVRLSSLVEGGQPSDGGYCLQVVAVALHLGIS
eukprot:SAG31_NODE_11154_length_1060_cov_1.181061_2_plen_175_part_01